MNPADPPTRRPKSLRPVADFPADSLRAVQAVLTDIDDTLTSDGRLTARAYLALERLQRSGLIVVPVTGRPAGWCDMIARFWPVDAVVGENGAFYFRYDRTARRMVRRYAKPASERQEDRGRLAKLGERITQVVSGAAISADQAYRESDLAIDYCEDVPILSPQDIGRIVAMFEAEKATAKVSSIHVNGWFGSYDKLAMSRLLLQEAFGISIDQARDRIVFLGDSPNDAPMFGFFPNAVGVANVLLHRDRLAAEPAWLTAGSGGEGFAEFVDLLLAVR
jgi:HAD superfamily hydrolase (TIGR01484 family)